jgi:hypothetical protein
MLAQNLFGKIEAPEAVSNISTDPGVGIGRLIQRGLQFLIIAAGLYALFNLVFAGYGFMSAADDPKKVAAAWQKIWQTLLGLAFAAGAFVLAAIFGELIFDNPMFLLQPEIQPLTQP